MQRFQDGMSRRAFISLPLLAPLAAIADSRPREYHFPYDYILGTSLDLIVRAGSAADAQRVERAVLDEIARLSAILNTRDPKSDIRRMRDSMERVHPRELREVLSAYATWEARSSGVLSLRPSGREGAINVDALGKAYIIDRALAAARNAAPSVEGVLLDIGGDIAVWGGPYEIDIADPRACYDNGTPISGIRLADGAIATSGLYSRGAHLIDARTGMPALDAANATVIARDAVTANALATALSILGPDEGLLLVERTPDAEALWIGNDGAERRSSGFARFERPRVVRAVMQSNWPAGYQLTIDFTLTGRRPEASKRPYLALWIEDGTGSALVRMLAVWGNRADYLQDLSSFWRLTRGRAMTRATRPPGTYQIMWDGLDDGGRPVPMGAYRVVMETNQELGNYAKRASTILCNAGPATASLLKTVNFENVSIAYGPRSSQA